jgi:hypothetical protein
MLITIEPHTAGQKPSTSNPVRIAPADHSKKAFITTENKPKVIINKGNEKNCSIGFMIVLRKPIINAVIKAQIKLLTLIPGISAAVKYTANADDSHLISEDIVIIP